MATVRRTKVYGRGLESELVENLLQNSFWAMLIPSGIGGQPFDIIACKDNVGYAIECKEIMSSGRFNPSRVEYNQRLAFGLWAESGNTEGWFAFKNKNGEILMEKSEKIINLESPIKIEGIPFKNWLEER